MKQEPIKREVRQRKLEIRIESKEYRDFYPSYLARASYLLRCGITLLSLLSY